MKLYVIILSLLLQGYWGLPCANASEADQEWQDAIQSAKQGEYDFAFISFKSILEDFPDSHYSLASKFALGEYFFLENNLSMASEQFKNFYSSYPQHEESLIALIYLFKIAQTQNNADDMKVYRSKIASFHQLTFIFNDKKYFKFRSGFQFNYKLVYYINKVELYVNGKQFEEVPI